MDLEKSIQEIAKSYEKEGYIVITHPDQDHLPSFARGLGVDLLASRSQEQVVVQVKRNRSALENDPAVLKQADIIAKQPGWRYDLHFLEEDNPLGNTARIVGEPTGAQIEA